MLFTHQFGIIGLIFANCVNMAVRGFCSLSISIDCINKEINGDDQKASKNHFNSFNLIFNVIIHKFFIAILALSVFGSYFVEYAI